MAQVLYDAINDGISTVDSHPVLAVHSLLDNQVNVQSEAATADDDIFQCGRCKKQFSAIDSFMIHKKECGSVAAINPTADTSTHPHSLPQNTILVRKIQVSSPSSVSGCMPSVVFTDADLLSLAAAGLDSNIITTSATTNSSIHISPNSPLTVPSVVNGQALTAAIQQVVPQISSLPSSGQPGIQTDAIEVPFINNKIVSGPVLFMSQPTNNSGITGVVLNISNSVLPNMCQSDQPAFIKPSADSETPAVLETQNSTNKEPSTVNIITEFHSSMVKSKKQTVEAENDDEITKKGNKLNCAYCWKSFTKNFDLQQHIRCHTGEKPFQCIVCGRAFAQKSNVKKHMQTHKVWPDGLSRTLPQISQRNASSGSEDGDCSRENGKSAETQDTENQENAFESTNPEGNEVVGNDYVCPYCTYIGKSYYKLKSHLKEHEMKKVYKCIVSSCGVMFNDLDPFLEHTKTHENEMTYSCHECSKCFSSLYDLGAHQYTHSLYPNQRSRTARRYFRCTLCLNKYSTAAALDHHMTTSSHVYACHRCDKVFPCERYLRRHLRIHGGSESFICNTCGKGFKTDNYLKVHMLTHSESKPFVCNVCKAAFNRKDKLKRHSLIHEPTKHYKCPFRSHIGCPKEFSRPDKLKAHILTHSCIKPFLCKVCGRSFTRRTHLRDHVKLHEQKGNSGHVSKWCDKKSDNSDGTKERECSKNVKKQGYTRKFRSGWRRKRKVCRTLKSSNSNTVDRKKKENTKEMHPEGSEQQKNDSFPEPEVIDDIPTAHIEIISTNGELMATGNVTHVSLPSNFSYDSMPTCFNRAVTDVIANEMLEQNSAANFNVATLHLSDSNSTMNCSLN